MPRCPHRSWKDAAGRMFSTFSALPFGTPVTVIFRTFLHLAGKQKLPTSLGNQEFTAICFSSKCCQAEKPLPDPEGHGGTEPSLAHIRNRPAGPKTLQRKNACRNFPTRNQTACMGSLPYSMQSPGTEEFRVESRKNHSSGRGSSSCPASSGA